MPPKRRNIGPLRTAIDRQGRGSVPARFFGVVGYAGADRCVGPDTVSSRDPSAGGHIGPPLHEVGWCSGSNGDWRRTGPPPRERNRARPWRRDAPGERRGVVTPPYGSNTGGVQRRADVGIGPYREESKPHQPPGPAARSEASAPAVTRSKRESAQRPSKRGSPPATTQAALSEAESAERAAGQIRSLPDDIRVQHGVQRLEVSAKPRPCSRRGCGN